jgi:hypothetical protein
MAMTRLGLISDLAAVAIAALAFYGLALALAML